jgi:CubicO group peptidase (beta-lactamase class C family)
VTEHVPEVTRSGYASATVEHLLDMTAAVDFVEDYESEVWKYDVACGWHPPAPGADSATILEYLPTIGPAPWRHGERLHYATPNTDLLGIVAERAGGAPLPELIGRELWSPLGAAADADLAVDPAGTAVISGGFCATLRDYARLGALVLDGGAHAGRAVVPAEWVDRLGRGDETVLGRCTVPEATGGASAYRNQWWQIDGRTVARGIHGQMVAVDPRAGVVVAILSSWPEATGAVAEAGQRALVAALCEHAGR